MTKDDGAHRIIAISLDNESLVRWSAEVEHERKVAVFDLLEANHFQLKEGPLGPYSLRLSLRQSTLIIDVSDQEDADAGQITLPVRPFRSVIKDYFMICESYYDAIKQAAPSRIEAIDMARRGLHDEGATMLREALSDQVVVDRTTSRRLFTLICVLHVRG